MDSSLFKMDGEEWETIKGTLKDAENRWGTPFYLFSEKKAKKNVEILKKSMGEKVQIAYALKANPWLVTEMAASADFIEVCSEGELKFCQEHKVSSNKIVVDGIYKSDRFINMALEMNVKRICADSWEQLKKIIQLSKGKKKTEVLLRVSSGNQFGMDEHEAAKCISICQSYQWKENYGGRIAIQYYPGTHRNNIHLVQKEIQRLQKWIDFFEQQKDLNLETIEFGSGIGVPYFEGENAEDYAKVLDFVSAYAKRLSKKYQVIYESGRNIAASSGIYVTKIFAKKNQDKKGILFCDGGTNHLKFHGGILGIRTPFAKSVCNNPCEKKGRFMICGSLCSEGDVLIRDSIMDDNTGIEDYIVFFNTGAYCATEAPNLFLSMEMPAIILYNKNNCFFQKMRSHTSSYKLIKDRT